MGKSQTTATTAAPRGPAPTWCRRWSSSDCDSRRAKLSLTVSSQQTSAFIVFVLLLLFSSQFTADSSAWFWREAVNAVMMVWDRTSLSNFSRPCGEALFCKGGGWGGCGFYFEHRGANELTEAVISSAVLSMWNSPCSSPALETTQQNISTTAW